MFKIKEKKHIEIDNSKLIMYLKNVIGCGDGKTMSKLQLATKLGVSKSTIDKWLDSKIPLNNEFANKICEVLNLDKNLFVFGSSKEYEFLLKYSTLSIASKQKIIEYIDFLLDHEHGKQMKLEK